MGNVCVRAMRIVRMFRPRLMDGEDIGASAWMGSSEMGIEMVWAAGKTLQHATLQSTCQVNVVVQLESVF